MGTLPACPHRTRPAETSRRGFFALILAVFLGPLSAGAGEALAHASVTEIDVSTEAANTASGQLPAALVMASDVSAGAESIEIEAGTGLPRAPSGNLRALPLADTASFPSAAPAEIKAGIGFVRSPSDQSRALLLANTVPFQSTISVEIEGSTRLAHSTSDQFRTLLLAGTDALPSATSLERTAQVEVGAGLPHPSSDQSQATSLADAAPVEIETGTGLTHPPSDRSRALPVAGTDALPSTPAVEIEPGTGRASAPSGRLPVPRPRPDSLTFDAPGLCALIENAAERHDIPPEFFARLIWQESRFDIAALSPVGAEGVAQFMPGTAALRGLSNSWDPRVAIPESARFLADLREQFGNLGLAAAAYNGGPDRVARWLGSGGRLPYETVNYVISITSRPVEWFREPGREVEARPLEEGVEFAKACGRMPVIATRAMGVGERKPWGVQIAAGISQGAAIRAFHRARGRLSSIIGGAEPVLVRSKLVAGRTAWSARVGADSRGEALALCQRIRSAGMACVVRQN